MKPKIVYIVGGLWSASGMERVLTMKANYMADEFGYDVFIVLTEIKDVPPYYPVSTKIKTVNFGINFDELFTLPIHKRIFAYIKKQRQYKKKLTQYLLEIKPDITISTIRREINFINSIPDGSIKIGEFHFNKTNYRNFECNYLPEFINQVITKLWMGQLIKELQKLSHFVVLSEEDKIKWTEIKNISMIYNPLPFLSDELSTCTEKKIISVGRYTHQKGFDLLIEAWKIVVQKHKDWELHIYGSGDRDSYQELAKQHSVSDSLTCEPATQEILDKYIDSSIFVLSSRYEGFGMVIAEAMACGVPAVSFDCPCGPKDIIKDGVDGLLVKNGNIKELADKICYLIENEHIRKDMGKQARNNVERFKMDLIASQWKKLFETLLESKK